jgi:hypothetical protein
MFGRRFLGLSPPPTASVEARPYVDRRKEVSREPVREAAGNRRRGDQLRDRGPGRARVGDHRDRGAEARPHLAAVRESKPRGRNPPPRSTKQTTRFQKALKQQADTRANSRGSLSLNRREPS